MKASIVLLGVLAIPLAQPASAEDSGLAPSGDWQVERSGESCRLWRSFGEGDAAVVFNLYGYGPDGYNLVVLSGASLPRNSGRARLRDVAFGDDGEPEEIIVVDNTSGGKGMVSFHLIGPNPAFSYFRGWDVRGDFKISQPAVQQPKDLSVLRIGGGEMEPIALLLGDMAAPMADLEECKAALTESWGYGEDALGQIVERPVLENRANIINKMKMPEAAVMNHITMIAQMRVAVDENGRASDCVVQYPSLSERAQRGLCGPFLTGQPFAPARNAAGEAVPGLFRFQYTYFIFD